MRRRVLAALAMCFLLPAARAAEQPEPASSLVSRLDHALASRGLRGARTAVLVVSREDGHVLYARDPERALVPASNQKILTALAALSAFGPTHRFTTSVYASGPPDVHGAVDFLAVRGGGDPALTSEDLWRLAADLRRRGLRKVREALILDDSAFDRERWHPGWGAISARAYHAPVGALNVNYGAYAVAVEPGSQSGDAARAFIDPPVDFLRLVHRAVTGPPGTAATLEIDRRAAGAHEDVLVRGRVPAGGRTRTNHRSVLDPTRYTGAVLRMQLAANGIAVEGPTRLGPVPPGAQQLLDFEGRQLAEIVRLFVKYSNNAIAESLVKALGARAGDAPGSWANGIPALEAELRALGLDTSRLVLRDGSGLSYDNRVTPRDLVEALRLADRSFRFGPEFVAALPIAAGDGTLEDRVGGASAVVRAKTGLLTRVTGLSGYARLADGSEAVFSILTNGFRSDAQRAMNAVDGFVAALVGEVP